MRLQLTHLSILPHRARVSSSQLLHCGLQATHVPPSTTHNFSFRTISQSGKMLRRHLSTLDFPAGSNSLEIARYVVMFLLRFSSLKFEVKTRNFFARTRMQPGKRDPRSELSYASSPTTSPCHSTPFISLISTSTTAPSRSRRY